MPERAVPHAPARERLAEDQMRAATGPCRRRVHEVRTFAPSRLPTLIIGYVAMLSRLSVDRMTTIRAEEWLSRQSRHADSDSRFVLHLRTRWRKIHESWVPAAFARIFSNIKEGSIAVYKVSVELEALKMAAMTNGVHHAKRTWRCETAYERPRARGAARPRVRTRRSRRAGPSHYGDRPARAWSSSDLQWSTKTIRRAAAVVSRFSSIRKPSVPGSTSYVIL
jgi:hypothetical protein